MRMRGDENCTSAATMAASVSLECWGNSIIPPFITEYFMVEKT